MGSKAFMDEAEKRLLANSADGVSFLMYDCTGRNGTWMTKVCFKT